MLPSGSQRHNLSYHYSPTMPLFSPAPLSLPINHHVQPPAPQMNIDRSASPTQNRRRSYSASGPGASFTSQQPVQPHCNAERPRLPLLRVHNNSMHHTRTDVYSSGYPSALVSGQRRPYVEDTHRVHHSAPTMRTLHSVSNSPASDSEGDDAMDERADWVV